MESSAPHQFPIHPGLVEFRSFLALYLLSCIFQLLDTGSVFRQGSTVLVVLTAIHLGLVAALGWALLWGGFVSLQWVEDGTISSMIVCLPLPPQSRGNTAILSTNSKSDLCALTQPFWGGTVAFFVATLYISLDIALGWTKAFGPGNPTVALRNIPLFVLTTIWPGVSVLPSMALP